MFFRDVAAGIHLLEHANVNCYIVQDADQIMVVDAGLPAMWPLLGEALTELGASPRDVTALVLTHAHFDHLGFASRLQDEAFAPVLVHPKDSYIAANPYRYQHEKARIFYPLRYPRAIPVLTRMARAGAMNVKGITHTQELRPGPGEHLPGSPEIIYTPGHTAGHCSLFFPERDALISGDALVTLDPYTGVTGPQIVSAAATADTHMALSSLDQLGSTGATTILTGHGQPWHDGAQKAVAEARKRGAS